MRRKDKGKTAEREEMHEYLKECSLRLNEERGGRRMGEIKNGREIKVQLCSNKVATIL